MSEFADGWRSFWQLIFGSTIPKAWGAIVAAMVYVFAIEGLWELFRWLR